MRWFIPFVLLLVVLPNAAISQDDHWLPTSYISFSEESQLSDSTKSILKQIGERMSASPTFKVMIESYKSNRLIEQKRNRKMVDLVLKFLIDSTQQDRLRFMIKYNGSSFTNQAIIRMPYTYEFSSLQAPFARITFKTVC